MKNNNLKSKVLLSILSFLTLSTATFAQNLAGEGGHSGNGGDPTETYEIATDSGERLPSWYMIKKDLIDGLEKDFHLSLDFSKTKFKPDTFKSKLLESLKSAKVYWDDQIIIVDGTPRPCENYKVENQLYIHCNRDDYVNSLKKLNAEAQYKFEVHEYASGAGLEPNHYGVSDYTFSSQISNQLETVTIKRWGKHVNFSTLDFIKIFEKNLITRLDRCPYKISPQKILETKVSFKVYDSSTNDLIYKPLHSLSSNDFVGAYSDSLFNDFQIKCVNDNSLLRREISFALLNSLEEINPLLKGLPQNVLVKFLRNYSIEDILNLNLKNKK